MRIRPATVGDVDQIIGLFRHSYGDEYGHPEFLHREEVVRLVYDDHVELFVAEDLTTDEIVGTASVLVHAGAYGDLVGEFGRLVVHPERRGSGLGGQLMERRVAAVERRLHVGLVANRCVHPYSQRISTRRGFACVGFSPGKLRIGERESVALFAKHFGPALSLRRNNSRVVSDVHALASCALGNCQLPVDAIVDDTTDGYPPDESFAIEEMTTEGYASLLRIERGRVHHREVFGPVRLHYGLFQLAARQSNYLLARRNGRIAGAIGFTIDPYERAVRVFELIHNEDRCVHQLLATLLRRCRDEWGVEYVDADVSAHSSCMQRTFLGVGFSPTAYIPAMVFHEVERLDAVRMSCLFAPVDLHNVLLVDSAQAIADVVVPHVAARQVDPRLLAGLPEFPVFEGCNEERMRQLALCCTIEQVPAGTSVVSEHDQIGAALFVLSGELRVTGCGQQCILGAGDALGEIALVESKFSSTTVTAGRDTTLVRLSRDVLSRLAVGRPDIAAIVYRNLARLLGREVSAHVTSPRGIWSAGTPVEP